jgi:5-aminopentanamidase
MATRRVCLVELPARFGEPELQLELAANIVGDARPDLVLLPEASLTGYVSDDLRCDLSPYAEPLEVGTARLGRLARRCGADVVGPVVERAGEACHNAVVGVTPEGARWLHYRKRHPWYPETWAQPGQAPFPLVRWRGLWLTCAVCFDLHFLPDEAPEVLARADALLFPSAWVDGGETRAPMLEQLARGFGLTVLNANWGPGRPAIPGQGGSLVARPDGRLEVLEGGQRLLAELSGRGGRPGGPS